MCTSTCICMQLLCTYMCVLCSCVCVCVRTRNLGTCCDPLPLPPSPPRPLLGTDFRHGITPNTANQLGVCYPRIYFPLENVGIVVPVPVNAHSPGVAPRLPRCEFIRYRSYRFTRAPKPGIASCSLGPRINVGLFLASRKISRSTPEIWTQGLVIDNGLTPPPHVQGGRMRIPIFLEKGVFLAI